MIERRNALSRNPSMCASCSSMADGLEDPIVSDRARMVLDQGLTSEKVEAIARGWGGGHRPSNGKFMHADSYQY